MNRTDNDGSATHVRSNTVAYAYSPDIAPVVTVESGSRLLIETLDARSRALLDRPTNVPFQLPRPTVGKGNPVTGPVAVHGADPGDTLVVTIDEITPEDVGWCGAHAHVGPVREGTVDTPIGRTCEVRDGTVRFHDLISVTARPMIGCIGTAPTSEPSSTALAGRHGGNMDQPVIGEGATVYLPVAVPGALLSVGDVHAVQGDGELSGVALEIPASVSVTVHVHEGGRLTWPWAQTKDSLMVLTAAESFEEARAEAVETMMRAIEARYQIAPAEALALLSLCGDLRIGASFGGPQTSLRLEVPTSLDLSPTP